MTSGDPPDLRRARLRPARLRARRRRRRRPAPRGRDRARARHPRTSSCRTRRASPRRSESCRSTFGTTSCAPCCSRSADRPGPARGGALRRASWPRREAILEAEQIPRGAADRRALARRPLLRPDAVHEPPARDARRQTAEDAARRSSTRYARGVRARVRLPAARGRRRRSRSSTRASPRSASPTRPSCSRATRAATAEAALRRPQRPCTSDEPGDFAETPVYDRARLGPGATFDGPGRGRADRHDGARAARRAATSTST